jgi:hypothetical protein
MDTENQTDFVAIVTLAAMCFEQSSGSLCLTQDKEKVQDLQV